ncbi:Os02g0151350, partial [Oryza sativa Japonica Group]
QIILRHRRRRRRRRVFPAPPPLELHEPGEDADHGRRVVRAGLRLHVRAAVVGEHVVAVGPADDGADEVVRVLRRRAVPRVEPLEAPDEVAVARVRRARRRAVVHPPRVRLAVPDEVARRHRVRPQYVIRLRPRELQHLAGVRRRRSGLVGGGVGVRAEEGEGEVGEDVGVDGEEEGGVGDVLEVVPRADEEEARRSAAGVVGGAAGVAAHAGAHVVLRL